jgi:hypothetical protein
MTTTKEEVDFTEVSVPEALDVPEVEVRGDEAVIRLKTPETVEERKVKLPKTVWG